MAQKTKQTMNYQQLKAELDGIMVNLQREDLDIDQAIEHYERGLSLLKQLQAHLKSAENRVTELKAKFKTDS